MASYVLSCCSTQDLTNEQLQQRNISYICFHYFLDGKAYLDDLGKTISSEDFYRKMEDGVDTKTSQVSVGEYKEYFSAFLKEGKDILHITLSSGISGTYNSAQSAAEMLREEYPERRIYIVDSCCASSGYGLFMMALADQRDAGASIEDLYDWAEKHKLDMQHWFFSSDLRWYVKGGRVSAPAGFIGGILGICPVLYVNTEGKLIPDTKVRTKKKAIATLIDRMEEYADTRREYNGKMYICHSACIEDAEACAAMAEKKFPNMDGKPQIYNIGTVIGCHTGPGTVAIFFWGHKKD